MKISKGPKDTPSVTFTTKDRPKVNSMVKWWKSTNKKELADGLLATAVYLKENQNFRHRQAAIYARLYGNRALFSHAGSNINRFDDVSGMPADRPTFNIVQSSIDTLVSRIGQNRPSPVFLTDNSDYKERNLAKKLNNFLQGEFYQTDAYKKGVVVLRDALIEGTGCIKILEDMNNRVSLERVLLTELFVDLNESIYNDPRQLYQVKLVDRAVLNEAFDRPTIVDLAEAAYVDSSAESSKSVSDLVMVVEGWRLPSGPGAKDGRHTIACSSGLLFDEEWTKDKFPFVFLKYSDRQLGFWAQGVAEQLMGTQMEINSLLYTISKAIKLVGVPRVFIEDGSKVVKAHNSNEIGVIVTYRGTKPSYEVAPCVPQELYAQLQRMIDYGYQQCGVSALQASSTKPAGLNSGEAIRSYDDISTDRFASLARRYDDFFIDLAYAIIDLAKEIAERDGKYQTVYPNKNGAKQIDLPKASLLQDEFVIQCFNTSSLPREPAGRMQKVAEMIQAGMITIKEGRRLLDFPDLGQSETLANASQERIYQYLDEIIEDGKYTPPDPFMDLMMAKDIVVQYYNLYASAKLEEEKQQMLRDFYSQVMALLSAGQPPAPGPMDAMAGGGAPATPQANPEPLPTSPLVPNSV